MGLSEVFIVDTKILTVDEIMDMIDDIYIDEYPLYAELFYKDSRSAVQKMGKRLETQYKKHLIEVVRTEKMKEYEKSFFDSGCKIIAGVDEVGRGPLAGPVVAAAVILPQDFNVLGINDSKKLTEKKREELVREIEKHALSIGIGIVDNKIIDEINILNAAKLAMRKAIESLTYEPEHILIDALKLEDVKINQTGIIKGDEKSISIAAASIVAKVKRDKMMCEYHNLYPQYDFVSNKGYGTQKHYEGIQEYGLCPLHRRTFVNIE